MTVDVDAPAPNRARLAINIAIGVLFSAVFVWLAVRNVNWDTFKGELDRVEWSYVAGYFGVLTAAHFLRLFRWGLTVRALGDVPWRRTLAVGAVGMFAIFALPARLGEFVRPLLISEGGKIGFGPATATVVVERIADGLTMSVVLFSTVLLLDPSVVPQEFVISGYVAASIFGGLSVGLLVSALTFRWIQHPIRKIVGMVSEPLAEKILGVVGGFFRALTILSNPRLAASYALLTCAIWGLSGVGIWVLFSAFPGTTTELGLLAAFTTLSVIVVGIMIPAGPGTVGVFHWAVVFALAMFAVEESAGLLVATSLHLMIAMVNALWGIVGAAWGRISFTQMFARRTRTETV
jgi:glycosyltransferase 2 family protein